MPIHKVRFQLVVRMRSSQLWLTTTASTSRSSVMRRSRHTTQRRPIISRLQPGDGPRTGRNAAAALPDELARPACAVVNPRSPFHPQLDRLGPQAVAAPVRRPGNEPLAVGNSGVARSDSKAARSVGHRGEKLLARRNGLALGAGPGPDAALQGARGEIRIAVGGGCVVDDALDAH